MNIIDNKIKRYEIFLDHLSTKPKDFAKNNDSLSDDDRILIKRTILYHIWDNRTAKEWALRWMIPLFILGVVGGFIVMGIAISLYRTERQYELCLQAVENKNENFEKLIILFKEKIGNQLCDWDKDNWKLDPHTITGNVFLVCYNYSKYDTNLLEPIIKNIPSQFTGYYHIGLNYAFSNFIKNTFYFPQRFNELYQQTSTNEGSQVKMESTSPFTTATNR